MNNGILYRKFLETLRERMTSYQWDAAGTAKADGVIYADGETYMVKNVTEKEMYLATIGYSDYGRLDACCHLMAAGKEMPCPILAVQDGEVTVNCKKIFDIRTLSEIR